MKKPTKATMQRSKKKQKIAKKRGIRNQTIQLKPGEKKLLSSRIISKAKQVTDQKIPTGTVHGDCLKWAASLPKNFVDLLILDPPYNLTKTFNGRKFSQTSSQEYCNYLDQIMSTLNPLLKETATIYICGDWFSSTSIFTVASNYFTIRNRITWEREKGRGAKSNWKNSSEDIWFCTKSNTYTFNVDAVKTRRKVLAPYKDKNGAPKDWVQTKAGNFRDTHPSNMWNDISIPFWSMSENTDHPTQKSEKLISKLILASSHKGDLVFDPFLGSGTSSVVAKKLKRKYLGIELDKEYCLLTEKRLAQADQETAIQGYADGVFWERNTLQQQKK